MNILVTGASGYLGSGLCPHLEQSGHRVVRLSSKNCDLTRQGALDAFNDVRYDQVYHLAAWTQAGDFCLRHPGEQWIINQSINTNVLAWWQASQPQAKLFSIGTSCAYSPGADLREENYMAGEPIESLYTYAMTKRMLLAGMIALHKQYGLRYLCVVPSTLYGPGYHTDGRQMHFIFDLIRKILRGRLFGEPVTLWGDGNQKRELVHRDDFVGQMVRLTGSCENDLINIGAGEEHSIRHFAKLICDEVGYPFEKIEFDTTRYVGATSKRLNIEKLRQLLPDYEPIPLAEGLRQTIAWFRQTFFEQK
jgi:GDP-L-fucose synthase